MSAAPNAPEEVFLGLVGKRAWGVVNGYGSMLALNFGEAGEPDAKTNVAHGEYHLWIKDSAWRVEHVGVQPDDSSGIDVGSGDDLVATRSRLAVLENREVIGAFLARPGLELTVAFEGGYGLRVFPYLSEDGVDHWVLFYPEHNVLVAGPGTQWRTESSR